MEEIKFQISEAGDDITNLNLPLDVKRNLLNCLQKKNNLFHVSNEARDVWQWFVKFLELIFSCPVDARGRRSLAEKPREQKPENPDVGPVPAPKRGGSGKPKPKSVDDALKDYLNKNGKVNSPPSQSPRSPRLSGNLPRGRNGTLPRGRNGTLPRGSNRTLPSPSPTRSKDRKPSSSPAPTTHNDRNPSGSLSSPPPGAQKRTEKHHDGISKITLIIAVAVTAVTTFGLVAFIFFCCFQRRRNKIGPIDGKRDERPLLILNASSDFSTGMYLSVLSFHSCLLSWVALGEFFGGFFFFSLLKAF